MRVRLSEDLQRSLSRLADRAGEERIIEVTLEPYSVASALSRQMGLGRYVETESPLYSVLMEIVQALEEPLRRHQTPNPRQWSEELLVPLMSGWTVPQSIEVLRALNREYVEVGPVRLDGLARELRTIAYDEVRDALVQVLERWRDRGDFDVDEEAERRKAEAKRQERRDRATEPQYTPPGRT